MSEPTWRAEVIRLNPASDVLLVKVGGRINAQQAHDIKRHIADVLPEIRALIADDGVEFAVVRKTRRKTLVRAGAR